MVNHPSRKAAARRKVAAEPDHDHDRDYAVLLQSIGVTFANATAGHSHLFLTDADGLYAAYLDNVDDERQVHTCHACRRFIDAYGGLVTIGQDGKIQSAMWDPESVPEFYRAAVAAMARKVHGAKVTGVYLSSQAVWGIPLTGAWTHFAVRPTTDLIYRGRALDAGQAAAALKERVKTVSVALGEFTPKALDEALRVLEADAVNRAERFIGPVKWLRALYDRPKGRHGANVLWKAVAAAPEGYCHPRASVIGPLLEDILAGLPFEDIRARFNAKMHPLQYQRPQAAPTAGNIKAAEALVEKLGLANSLKRRFARIEDCQQLLWTPKYPAKPEPAGGIFGHLTPKQPIDAPSVDLPAQTMTWDKFCRTVLPDAERLEFAVPSRGNFIAMTAPADPDAETLFKWPNGVAWYVYHGGASAQQFNLRAGSYAKVNAVVPFPTLWGDRPMPFIADGVILILDGARDMDNRALSLFPETMRDDLHGIRAVVEAHSRSGTLEGADEATACGYDFRKGYAAGELRARKSGAWSRYRIDRWD